MKTREIFDILNRLYPVETACGFDNVGFLVGDRNAEVMGILVCLDCTLKSLNEAEQKGANLIVTHHPVIFDPLKSVTDGSVVFESIRRNISVISMHTNLDIGKGGVNDSLCQKISPISVEDHLAKDGYLLKTATFSPISPEEFANYLKRKLGGAVKYISGEKQIERVLICSGSGGGYLSEVTPANADALLTADVKHNQFLEAENMGVSLFDAGHFDTEDVVTKPLAESLKVETENKIPVFTYHPDSIKSTN